MTNKPMLTPCTLWLWFTNVVIKTSVIITTKLLKISKIFLCQTISDRLACKRRVCIGQLLKIFYRKQLHLFLWIRTRNSWFIEKYDSFSLVTFPIEVLDSNQNSRKMQKSYTTAEQDGFFQTTCLALHTPASTMVCYGVADPGLYSHTINNNNS